MNNQRFVNFIDTQSIEHTYRLIDIQAVGVGKTTDQQSYIRAFGFAMIVPQKEALRIRQLWIQEG